MDNFISEPSIFQSIVYTTKLDHMDIFNSNIDLSEIEFKSLVSAVEKESKPKLVHKRKLDPNLENGGKENITYETLEKKVKTANKKAKDIRRRNNKLLALCKPLSIVLIDLKHLPNQTNQHYQKVVLSREELMKRFGPYLMEIESSEDDTSNKNENDEVVFVSSYYNPIKQSKSSKKATDKQNQQYQNKLIILYDQQRRLKYLYLIGSRGIVTEYRIFDAEDKIALAHRIQIAMYDTTLEKVNVRSCCWYDRVEKIESLNNCSEHTKQFISIPHVCDPFDCKCCCNKHKLIRIVGLHNYYKKSSTILQLMYDWLPTILRVSVPLSPYLTPKPVISAISSDTTQPKTGHKMFLKSTTIRIENNIYALGDNGHIKSYIKNDQYAVANITATICCWYSRKHFIDRLMVFAAKPDVISFLKAPHKCAIELCTCCCKPAKRKKEKLLFYSISPRHTGECSKKKLNMKIKFAKQTVFETPRSIPNAIVPQSVPPLTIPGQGFPRIPVTVPASLIKSSPATISTPGPSNVASLRPALPTSFLQTLTSPISLPATTIPAVIPFRPLTVPPPLQRIQSGGSIILCPQSSIRQIETKAVLEKLKNVRFIYKPGSSVSVNLGVPLKQLGLLELKVLERILESFDTWRAMPRPGPSMQNEEVPPQATEPKILLELYAQMSSIHSNKSRQCIKSYRDFMRKNSSTEVLGKIGLNNAKNSETVPNTSSNESTSSLYKILSEPRQGDIDVGTNKPGPSGKLRVKTPNEISHSVIID